MGEKRDWVRVVAEEQCDECGLEASAVPRSGLTAACRQAAREWVELLERTDAASLRRRGDAGRWSALEYGAHSAGVLRLFTERIARAVAVDDPALGWWDHEEAAVSERYNDQAPLAVAAALVGGAQGLVAALDALGEAAWARGATRRPGERFTVEGMARFALHEVHHHLHDARAALEAAPEADHGFGRTFTDHMALARFDASLGWADTAIVDFQDLPMSPASMVFHYGQAVFEGLKAFRQPDGTVALFRPHDHAARLDRSARRLVMPALAPGAFVAACAALVRTDIDSVPSRPGQSLYLRPMLVASEVALGVRPATEYLFAVIASPAGSYFSSGRPVTLWATEDYSRAAPGGTGSVKCAGNYAASLAAREEALANGCDEILWLDAHEHRWVEELSGMNVVFIADGPQAPTLVTPPVGDTTLDGITRRSLLDIAADLGLELIERPVSIDEVCDGRTFVEAFACGTAAVVTPVGAIQRPSGRREIGGGDPGPVTLRLRDALLALQEGRAEDARGWRVTVEA